MNANHQSPSRSSQPDISFVMPCYNEERGIGYTIPQLVTAFEKAGYCVELIAVENGSRDRTGEVIKRLATQYPAVVHHRVDRNEGYGNGVLSGIPLCTAPLIGFIPADLQVDVQDAVKLFMVAHTSKTQKIFKVHRRFRAESMARRVVSVTYNLLTKLLFGDLGSSDINGQPKIIPRECLKALNLQSKDWFLDLELMIKAKRLGLSVYELNVFAQMRIEGTSNIRPSSCWEFTVNMLTHRFGKQRKKLEVHPLETDKKAIAANESI